MALLAFTGKEAASAMGGALTRAYDRADRALVLVANSLMTNPAGAVVDLIEARQADQTGQIPDRLYPFLRVLRLMRADIDKALIELEGRMRWTERDIMTLQRQRGSAVKLPWR